MAETYNFFYPGKWKEPLYSLKVLNLDHLMNDDPNFDELMLSQKAPNLEILNVADTMNIYRINTIRNLNSLRYLDVSGSLSMLTEDNFHKQWSSVLFANLTNLKFARNRLKMMTILKLYKTTPRVVNVDLSMNMISDVDGNIKYLLNLQYLNLNDNQITSLEYLHDLAHLKSLKIAQIC